LYLIPNLNNIVYLIYKIHVSILHQGFIKMKDKINELKIFYNGINYDISEINNICEICTQKNLKFYKRSL